MFFEVNVLEVGVHVQAGRAEVVGPGNVRHQTLAAVANVLEPHPHVPVPHLEIKLGYLK